MSADQLQRFADGLIPHLETYIKRVQDAANAAWQKRFDVLEKRIADMPVPKDGERGADGKDGAPGEKGEAGPEGPVGPQGAAGERGQDGAAGTNGRDGADGANGVDGINGKDGANGLDGKDGAAGRDGIDGTSGESAYEMALRKGFRGDESAFLNSLVGEAGRDGRDGRDAKGEPGEPGKDGRDGFDIDDVKCIEVDESGNCELILERGERKKSIPFRVPAFVPRGVYKSDTTYYRGNGVTAGGSMFVAVKDNPQGTPGHSDDWQLYVKRGRDGDRPTQLRSRDPAKPYQIGDRS